MYGHTWNSTGDWKCPCFSKQWKKPSISSASIFFLNQKNVDFCSHPAAVTRWFRIYSWLKVIFFAFSSDRYVTLPVLFLDLLSVLRVANSKERNKQIDLYFKLGLRLDRRNPWKLTESRIPRAPTAGICGGFVVGGAGLFRYQRTQLGPLCH